MLRRTTLLSTLIITLLLGACSNKNEDAPAADAADADSQATEQAEAPAPEAPRANHWPAVAPMIAGSYSGDCQWIGTTQKVPGATIVLAADGKASAPDISADFGQAKSIQLMRNLDPDGTHRASAALTEPGDGPALQLMTGGKDAVNMASISAKGRQLTCNTTAPIQALNGKPLHVSLAKLVDVTGQKIKCLKADNILKHDEVTIRIGGGTAAIGDRKFDLAKAEMEMALLDDGASNLSYQFTMPGGQLISVVYGAANQVKAIVGMGTEGASFSCSSDL
jgi:hypothetical protein